jgi:hypothetical protein
MSKRWTYSDDTFLHAFYEDIGAFIGPHDLGRSEASTKARVRHLKSSGAWAALDNIIAARTEYHRCLGHPSVIAWIDEDEE